MIPSLHAPYDKYVFTFKSDQDELLDENLFAGGTTIAIKKFTAIGWIKPVPSRERIKEMLQERKDTLQDRFNESKLHYKCQMKEKRTHVMDEMRRYKTEMRNLKDKVKKM